MTDRIARKLRIYGRVQGVWYRESMRIEAERRGVCGWVRNCADGTVEAHVEGAPAAVEEVLAWSRQGPPSASVSHVESEATGRSEMHGFKVLPSA